MDVGEILKGRGQCEWEKEQMDCSQGWFVGQRILPSQVAIRHGGPLCRTLNIRFFV